MMAVDEMGDAYYALPFSHAIGGTGPLYPQGIYISGIEAPTGLAFDSDGNLIFSDFQRNTVSRYSFADQSRTVITSDLRGPEGLAVDTMGTLYIADSGNKRIVKIPKVGPSAFLTQNVGTPLGVAVDVAGNLFVSETEQQKTIELPVDGSPAVLLSGDLRQPNQVAVGWNGDLYVANGDLSFSRLYRLRRSQPQPILFEKTTVGNASGDSPRFFSISNGGNGSMMISGLSVDNADFSVVAEGGGTTCLVGVALAAGHTCQVGVNYRPLHQDRQGLSKGSLTVSDDSLSAASMQVMQLTGNFAVPPLVDPSLSLKPASGKVSLYNTPLYLDSHSLSPAQVTFNVVSGAAHLNADASGQHYLRFAGVGSVVIEADQPATDVYAAGSIRNTLVVALPGRLLSLEPTSSTRAMLSESGASFTFLLTPEVGSLLDSVQLTLDGLPSGMTYTMMLDLVLRRSPSTSWLPTCSQVSPKLA